MAKGFTYDPYKESDKVTQAEKAAADAAAAVEGYGDFTYGNQAILDDVIKKILNREKFSYDLNGDALYQQYKDKYIQQGKMAMQDTMGQAAAMTGGYGNSYAATVGNQAYQASLENLNNVVPELYQMAYDRYNQEGQDMLNQYGLLADDRATQYGEWQDGYNRAVADRDHYQSVYDSERGFDYGKWQDGRDFAYGEHRDEISDEQWQAAMDYQKERDAVSDEQWQAKFDAVYGKEGDSADDKDDDLDDTADDYADWDAMDWEAYFASIRNSEGVSAAVAELERMSKAGFIPQQFASAASSGARGGIGH